MKASVVDLRYRIRDVLKALDRHEEVTILYRGKVKGVIKPRTGSPGLKVREHPFFGMREPDRPVSEVMDKLRGGRY